MSLGDTSKPVRILSVVCFVNYIFLMTTSLCTHALDTITRGDESLFQITFIWLATLLLMFLKSQINNIYFVSFA